MNPASGFAVKEAAQADAPLNRGLVGVDASAGADFRPGSISRRLVGSHVHVVIPATGISVVRILVGPDLNKPSVRISSAGAVCGIVVYRILLDTVHINLELARGRRPAPNCH